MGTVRCRLTTHCLLCTPIRTHSNSEIYNHQYLRDNYLSGMDIRSKSDSVVPGYLYQKLGDTNEIWNLLDGIFACIIYDGRYVIGRGT